MKTYLSYLMILAVLLVAGCTQKVPLPKNTIQFESNRLGLRDSEQSLTVNINFTRATDQAGTIFVIASSPDLKYATDYTTEPATEKDTLKLSFSKKATSISFKINHVEGSYPRSDDVVNFTIKSIPISFAFGLKTKLEVSFSELSVGKDGEEVTMDPQVGGPQQPNIVFVDLSANRQKTVSRDVWDLGFYAKEGGGFHVILNETLPMMTRLLNDKTELKNVGEADTVGFSADMALDVNTVFGADEDWKREAKKWVDNPNGDLAHTAIAEVSATAEENKVYIINRGLNPDGTPRGWVKIRVLRNGADYELRYANIDEQTYKVWRIGRSETHLFQYIHFDNGPVEVEPRKEYWDIAFTTLTALTAFGPPGAPLVPYYFTDMVIQNRYEVQTAQVMDSVRSYEDFGEADLESLDWGTSQITIGSNWRRGGGPGTEPSLHADRFYVVRDVRGNVYKLKFTAFTKNGERGHPQFTYKLVQ